MPHLRQYVVSFNHRVLTLKRPSWGMRWPLVGTAWWGREPTDKKGSGAHLDEWITRALWPTRQNSKLDV
jgi:hypothetical protein